jgi:carboxyl-terminal processing protease
MDDKVAELVERIAAREIDGIWPLAKEVEKLGVRARVAIRKAERANRQNNPKISVALAYALYRLDDTETAAEALLEIAANEKAPTEARVAAIDCIDYLEPEGAGGELIQLKDTILDPDVKIALSRTAWKLEKNPDVRDILINYLESDEDAIKYRAALALASVGEFDSVRAILRTLSREPSPRGRLAKMYIEHQKFYEEAIRASGLTEKPLIRKLNGRIEELEAQVKVLTSRLKKKVPPSSDPLLAEVIQKIEKYYLEEKQTDREKLINAAVYGICTFALDRHSSYMDEKATKEFMESINQVYAGIGARVSKPRPNEFLTIEQPIYGGPAYRKGLRAGDLITEVNGESVLGKTISETVTMLKGTPKTAVTVKVFRPGYSMSRDFFISEFQKESIKELPKEMQKMFDEIGDGKVAIRLVSPGWLDEAEVTFRDITIVRDQIELESVRYRMYPGNIGYIQLQQFGEKGEKEVESALKALEKQGMEALIFDLRDNGGGLLEAAWKIADKFLKGGKLIVYSEGRERTRAPYTAYHSRDEGTHPDYPVVILVNKGSASASEIVSGALRSLGRAILIGEKTYGKGSVQQPFFMRSRALPGQQPPMLKLTVAKYYFHDNTSIHEEGIKPDIQVNQTEIRAGIIEEAERIHIEDAAGNYLLKHYEKHKSLFEKLAETDYGDPSAYPDFDKWYDSLKTTLDRDTVRRYLRIAVRIKMQDEIGEELPPDLVDDKQLQTALAVGLGKIGKKIGDFKQYEYFAGKLDKEKTSTGK